MRKLILDLIPHAPQIGLYVEPNIPPEKLRNALDDYASSVAAEDVVALYDATLLSNGKDGAVLTSERIVFQNHDLEPVHDVRYADIVGVERRRKLISGRRVVVSVNRGRATFDLTIDFSGRPKASEFIARFLKEAMVAEGVGEERTADLREKGTDPVRVRRALRSLRQDGALTSRDEAAMLRAIGVDPDDSRTKS